MVQIHSPHALREIRGCVVTRQPDVDESEKHMHPRPGLLTAARPAFARNSVTYVRSGVADLVGEDARRGGVGMRPTKGTTLGA